MGCVHAASTYAERGVVRVAASVHARISRVRARARLGASVRVSLGVREHACVQVREGGRAGG
jgi:hypothetical protein